MTAARRRCLVWAAAICLGGNLPRVQAQTVGPTSGFAGTAAISIEGADEAVAREKALNKALHDAVRSAIVATIGADQASARETTIEHAVLARSRSFVTGYQVMDEGVVGPEYHVSVLATVATAALRRSLENLDASPPAPPDSAAAEAPERNAVEASADVLLRGALTASRYRSIRGFLERQVPGVRSVSVTALEPGAMTLRLRGAFPAHALSGYLSQVDFGSFRLVVAPVAVGPDLEVVVQDVEVPR